MMMYKKSSDGHLFNRGIIDSGGKQCTLFSPIYMILFGNYAIVPLFMSSSKQMPILQKMDLVETFDMFGERSCGGCWAM